MFGIWSIVPPLVAVALAILTRKVVISLFVSIWIGGLIFSMGNPFGATAMTFTWMKDVMVDSWNARFLVLVALLGIGAAFMYKVGGSYALTRSLEQKLNNRKRAQFFAFILGIVVFFNDYVNSVIAGNASKDINARYRVSKEKLAYILDATAAPMATIGPVSDWIGFQVSLIAAAFVSMSMVETQPYFAFLSSIQWNFYSILSLVAVPLFIFGKDFGPMATAELRALKTGKLIDDGAVPLSSVEMDLGDPINQEKANIWFFILPLVTLIGVGIWALWYTGGGPEGKNLMDALADTEVDVALTWAAFAMSLVGVILALIQKFSFKDIEDTVMGGIRTMLPAIIIMILAWAIGAVTDALGTADFVVGATESWMSPALLPFLIFVICMFISFSTGTSWGTMAIMTPIGIPLAFSIGGASLIPVIIGSIFAGAIFGDHCSPISDTTVMASIFAGSDHIAHVKTQMPYAVLVAGISAVLYLLSSFIRIGWLLLIIGIVALVVLSRILGSRYQKKHFSAEEIALLDAKHIAVE
ncbi:MAG: Na+/H+ antiporter NhaC family protein [Sphaerochaetaceae bacterium]|jgi:Na+/H+ antiporter NhaC|nr:Na+/H+ antiporter NhaC family protein [Sphaerochaetaceae bacterium]MDX9939333.1 Na+/H+ antiporter NhaC family protein [Sphaerochaetaceae bacterium]